MSLIGSSVSQTPLAAPLAAVNGQIRAALANERQAQAGAQDFQVHRAQQADQTLNDVDGPGGAADRDADGRMGWSHPQPHGPTRPAAEETSAEAPRHRPEDPLHERGLRLDVEA